MSELTGADTSATSPVAVDVPIYLEAFERKKPVIRAVPEDALLPVNVDPIFAIQVTHKAVPRVKALLPRLKRKFTDFDASDVDSLLDLSHAFAHATTLLRAAEPQVSGFDALVEECGEKLGKLESYVRAAIEAGVMSTTRLSELKGGLSHRNLVHDMLLVAQIYRANWSKIEGKTFFTLADIRDADAYAARLNSALAERESRPGAFDEVSLDRQKAFTLFYRAYERVRLAVEYLLKADGEGHLLDEVMPSLNTNRGSRKRRDDSESDPAPVAAASATPDTDGLQLPRAGKVGTPDSDPFTS
jgi:hypothetical protein